MDRATLQSLRKKLEQARDQLRHEAARNANEGRDSGPDGVGDVADQSLTTYTKEFSFSQSENEAELLQMIEGSLARMDEGAYGKCLNCGRDIGMKRLEAVPWTHLCIDCQTKAEQIDNDRRIA